jgi:hypothetical protein
MTEKFDLNATPECDSYDKSDPLDALAFAQGLERRARLAEEKLSIAMEGLERIGDMEDIEMGPSTEAWMALHILGDIKGVGR